MIQRDNQKDAFRCYSRGDDEGTGSEFGGVRVQEASSGDTVARRARGQRAKRFVADSQPVLRWEWRNRL